MEDGDLVAWNRVKWKTQDLTEEEVTIKIARPALHHNTITNYYQ